MTELNPFVSPHQTPVPILTFGMPEEWRYRDWEIHIDAWTPRFSQDPRRFQAEIVRFDSPERLFAHHSVQSPLYAVTRGQALRAAKIAVDLEQEIKRLGVGRDGSALMDTWGSLMEAARRVAARDYALIQTPTGIVCQPGPVTRAEVAREYQVHRKGVRAPGFDWFDNQPVDYRVRLIDRVLDYRQALDLDYVENCVRSNNPRRRGIITNVNRLKR